MVATESVGGGELTGTRPPPDAVVLLGRGALAGWPQQELDRLVAAVRAAGRYRRVEGALLDQGTDADLPDLPGVLQACINGGARRILIVPVYVPVDRSLRDWLPKIVRRWLKKRHLTAADVEIVLADAIGDHPALGEAVARVAADAEQRRDVRLGAPERDRADQWLEIPHPRHHAFVCIGPRCAVLGSAELLRRLRDRLRERDMEGHNGGAAAVPTGCLYPCNLGPLMIVYPDGTWYGALNERAIDQIVEQHFAYGHPVEAHVRPRPRAEQPVGRPT